MKLVSFCPYGLVSEEAGIISLLCNYLREKSHNIMHVVCNGTFPICERDQKINWKRTLDSCSICTGEQFSLGKLAQSDVIVMSKYISADDILFIERNLAAISRDNLLDLKYRDISLFDINVSAFKKIFGRAEPNFLHKNHEPTIRKLFFASILSYIASEKIGKIHEPDLGLVADGTDMITQPMLRAFDYIDIPTVIFKWRSQDKTIKIYRNDQAGSVEVPFFVETFSLINISQEKWSKDIIDHFKKIESYLALTKK